MSESTISQRKLRRKISASDKLAIVQASYQPGVLVAEIARKYDVGVSSLIKWRKSALEGSLMSVKDEAPAVSALEAKKLKKRIQQLERLLGRKSLQIDILQEAIELAREKKLISRQPLPGVDDIVND